MFGLDGISPSLGGMFGDGWGGGGRIIGEQWWTGGFRFSTLVIVL